MLNVNNLRKSSVITKYNNYITLYPGLNYPLLLRGGALWDTKFSGNFYFFRVHGSSAYDDGFRSVIIPV